MPSTATATTATDYTPLLPRNITVVLLPRPPLRRSLLLSVPFLLLLLVISLSVFFLYPASPTLSLTRIRLNRIKVLTSPSLSLSLSFSVALRVRNPDFFSLRISSLHVAIAYRGRDLGFLDSQANSKVRPRAVSYVNATLDLDGGEVVEDVIYFIADVAQGVIPFDATTDISGKVGIFFLNVPIKGKVSCEVFVNIKNQMITDQNCYPKGLFEESRTMDGR